MRSILFVCLGNICRSPLAEGITREFAEKKGLTLHIDSAGTGSWHVGEAPCANSIKVAAMHGIDIAALRARQVRKEDFETFDLVIGLDTSNMQNLKAMGAKNLVKLGSFGEDNKDVPDPYFFEGFEGFLEVYRMIERCVGVLLEEIEYNTCQKNSCEDKR
ncbi:MAG: low molecular weight phosphotyrosine protein phosphatase [Thiovulaceae bacterium]|nr:low molecular weight phosphotyrosine protein phosphatase [Sulfurimonadaceae bacterium]